MGSRRAAAQWSRTLPRSGSLKAADNLEGELDGGVVLRSAVPEARVAEGRPPSAGGAEAAPAGEGAHEALAGPTADVRLAVAVDVHEPNGGVVLRAVVPAARVGEGRHPGAGGAEAAPVGEGAHD